MPINASHEYFKAEKEYLQAQDIEDKIFWLEEMIRRAPKHKGAENLLAELRSRLKKLRERAEKAQKKGGKRKKGVKKEGYQFVIVGFANSGKSTLMGSLTNAEPDVSDYPFTTKEPAVGVAELFGARAQVVDMPALPSSAFDRGVMNNADCLLLACSSLDEMEELQRASASSRAEKIFVLTKSDLLSSEEKRKLEARLRSMRLDFVLVSSFSGEGLPELKQKMFAKTGMIRVYAKEPGKERTDIPMLLPSNATVRDFAERILKGLSSRVKEARVTGPSAKFPNQRVGLGHELRDMDVVELRTV